MLDDDKLQNKEKVEQGKAACFRQDATGDFIFAQKEYLYLVVSGRVGV